ncbi:MAG: GTPase Obg [Patescibacteria group bacterium]|nr:MAG: GTPase Obg [Patescibacteria group bacterium]
MIDLVKIKVKAGDGGDGKVSFLRGRGAPKGGPDGGDGGDGGDVYFVADRNLATLRDFRAKDIFAAQNGDPGGKKKMFGADGEDLRIPVPLGTLVYEIKDNREILVADLSEDGQEFLIARGGIGGKGNFRFRSATNRTPTQFTHGTKGEEKIVKLEVKLVADIGLIGLPNAGKSTLLNRLTHAEAKVGSYPFTTLSPNLGVMELEGGETIILADIPGLIEGASEGKGLGDEFLRHIERTRILVHLIDPLEGYESHSGGSLADNALSNYYKIRKELEVYGKGLSEKPEINVVNKIDVTEIKGAFEEIKKVFKEKKVEVIGISGVTGEGISDLISIVREMLKSNPKRLVFGTEKPVKLYTIDNLPNKRVVFGRTKVSTFRPRGI